MRNIKDNAIVNMTFNFSLDIIEFIQQLKSQKIGILHLNYLGQVQV